MHSCATQGVTLGGTGKQTGKRHPTLADHVVVGAGAKAAFPAIYFKPIFGLPLFCITFRKGTDLELN